MILFKILLRLTIVVLTILLMPHILPGIDVQGVSPAIETALLLGIINISVRPILLFLTLPVSILTLGVSTLFINGGILWVVGEVIDGFSVKGFFPAVGGALIISIVTTVTNILMD